MSQLVAKLEKMFFYMVYCGFFIYLLTQKKDDLLWLFLLLPPLYMIFSPKARGVDHKISNAEILFGFAGLFYGLGTYVLLVLMLLPFFFAFYLYSKDLTKSLIGGYYLWSTIGLVVYSLSLLNTSAIMLAFLLMVLGPVWIIYARRDEVKDVFKSMGSEKFRKEVSQILVLLLLLTIVFSPVVNEKAIPRTLGNMVYTTSFKLHQMFTQFGSESVWYPFEGGGSPIFVADSPMFYHDISIAHIILTKISPSLPFVGTYNLLVFNVVVMIALSIFYLAKIVNPKGHVINAIIPLIPVTLYLFIHFLSFYGAIKSLSSIPAVILVLAIILEAKNISWLEVVLLATTGLLHHFVAAVEFLILSSIVWIMGFWTKTGGKIKLPGKEARKELAAGALISIAILSVYAFPALYYSKYTTSSKETGGYSVIQFLSNASTSFPKILEVLTSFLTSISDDIESMNVGYSNMMAGVIFLAGLGYIVYYYFQKGSIPPYTRTLGISFLILLLLNGILTQLTFTRNMEYGRSTRLIWSVLIVVIVAESYSLMTKKMKTAVILLMAVFLITSSTYASQNLRAWYNEEFISSPFVKPITDQIASAPKDGRWVTFGRWIGIDTMLPAVSDVFVSLEDFAQSHHTKTIFEDIRGTDVGDERLYINRSGDYLANQLINTGTKYIWFNLCERAGALFANKTYDRLNMIKFSECDFFGIVKNMSLATTTIVSDKEYPKEEIYSKPDGYQTVWIIDPIDGSLQKPSSPSNGGLKDLILKRTDPWNLVVEGDIRPGDWVLVKEKYSPMWSAVQDGKPLVVYKTNTGMMLVLSASQTSINFHVDALPIQKVFSVVSVISIVYVWLLMGAGNIRFVLAGD